jgi:hypothetical protein
MGGVAPPALARPARAWCSPRVNGHSLHAPAVLFVALSACTVVTPTDPVDAGTGKEPGEPFEENVCFQCALGRCSIAANACTMEATCSRWLTCVSACPTDDSGVAAEGDCVRRCGLPLSAEVLFGCIQDFSTGTLLGCELACAPP